MENSAPNTAKEWDIALGKLGVEHARLISMRSWEAAYRDKGMALICGVDEVGRGCLLGPVYAAAVIMPEDSLIYGVNDSKKISEAKRKKLNGIILSHAASYGIGICDNFEIDRLNILEATKLAMRRAIDALSAKPEAVITDAVRFQSALPSTEIVKGDEKSYLVACASIIAKVARDAKMASMANEYPEYDLGSNKGYATKSHRQAIAKFGPCTAHRFSFISHFWPEAPLIKEACAFLWGEGYEVKKVTNSEVIAFSGQTECIFAYKGLNSIGPYDFYIDKGKLLARKSQSAFAI
ncbi:MAG: ribonuclease HII [Eubacteriaceae bacterium]|nr:ribonuclease HII [Eubacteriaceae bacterium]